MKRKLLGVALFCLVLLAAIVAGYWDMLTAEKLRVVRETASDAVGDMAGIARPSGEPTVPDAVPPAASGEPSSTVATDAPSAPLSPAASEPAMGETGADAGPETADVASPGGPTEDATRSSAEIPDTTVASPAAPGPVTSDRAVPSPDLAGTLATPTFDILRVEPDGSMVIAGRAPAETVVTLRDGSTVIGSEPADATGEFVIVLDEPLPVGGHQIRIEAKAEDGLTVISKETAVVSIPETGRENELLAIVEAPDQASRLIAIPALPETSPTPSAGADEERVAATPEIPVQATSPTAPAKAAPAPADEKMVARASGRPAAPAFVEPAAASVDLAVEAVEIEDDTIYVAGRASGSSVVRVYIDNGLLAEDRGVAKGRFLVTARAQIGAGEHMVRADALDAAGAVVARVEVPFVKPEGRAMSAISSATPRGELESAEVESAGAGSLADAAQPEMSAAARSTPSETLSVGGPADIATAPAATSGRAAGETVETLALAGRNEAVTPSGAADPAEPAPAGNAHASPDAGEPTSPTNNDTAGSATASGAASPKVPSPSAPLLEEPAALDERSVPVTRQAALQPAESRVIIRRGDTLWRISRETYGLGRRYTVIYLANGDQIRDPDRIYPGQVFRVPEKGQARSGAGMPPG